MHVRTCTIIIQCGTCDGCTVIMMRIIIIIMYIIIRIANIQPIYVGLATKIQKWNDVP